jgi:hypothetical protein
MLVQDLIATAMSDLGLIAPEETPSPSELTRGQLSLNNLLASWSAQGVPVFSLTRELFVLTGAQSYTIGPGAVMATTRPVKVEAVAVVSSNGARRAVHIGTVEEWTAVMDTTATGLFAEICYFDGAYPATTIYLAPRPVSGSTLELESYKALTQYANLGDPIDLPPGYLRALEWGLALELARTFGVPVTPDLVQLATDAKISITGLNEAILGRPSPVEPPLAQPEKAA